jgi:hypothetical protein
MQAGSWYSSSLKACKYAHETLGSVVFNFSKEAEQLRLLASASLVQCQSQVTHGSIATLIFGGKAEVILIISYLSKVGWQTDSGLDKLGKSRGSASYTLPWGNTDLELMFSEAVLYSIQAVPTLVV